MTAATDLFVEEARAVSVGEAAGRLGVLPQQSRGTGWSRGAPCPACGGTDRFSVNPDKSRWNCRGDRGGRDGIGLAAHVLGLDTDRREDFLLACAAVTGRPVPDGAPEAAEAATERASRLAETRRRNAERAEAEAAAQGKFREAERAKACGKWLAATPGGMSRDYLAARLDCAQRDLPDLPFLRSSAAEPYWHGQDERRNPVELFTGWAMILPFADPEGQAIGCHITWIDLSCLPKCRPSLKDEKGKPLPTKKMRGSKKGGLIPLVGFIHQGGLILPEPARHRLVTGEGIENTMAIGLAEGFRADTFYAAAGDLGNLAGPADPSSGFAHPGLKNKGGKAPMRVAGPVPREGQEPGEACQVHAGVTDILLVADGDSERFATAAAMARAVARLAAPDRTIAIAWPPEGSDFADMLAGARAQEVA